MHQNSPPRIVTRRYQAINEMMTAEKDPHIIN